MPKPKTIRQLVKIADRWFSQFIRLENATDTGYCTCVTCGKIKHWKELHSGHFIGRMWIKTRYRMENAHPQCCHCNTFLDGNYENYYPYMIDEYGQDIVDYLKLLSREAPNSLSRGELEIIIDWTKETVANLRKEKGL